MNVVIISGPEATGKSAIGKEIGAETGFFYLSKDKAKEKLYDKESHNTWDYKWYENLAKKYFFKEIKDNLDQNNSIIIESNFIKDDIEQLADILNNRNIIMHEVFCTAKGLTSFKRFVQRNESKIRHKGHHDRRWYAKVLSQDLIRYLGFKWPYKPLGFTNKLMIVDSTNFAAIDYKKILNFINN
jgi:adenylate kinase family enzyme